jgi:hypothetical protein
MGRTLISSIEQEYRRYKTLGDGALAQLADDDLVVRGATWDNSIATIVWHVAGNLESRFTEFLDSDGEKPWRNRESEFEARSVPRAELAAKWDRGWKILFDALAPLTDADLERMVAIRGQPLPVHEALHRSLAHASYHVGQIVYQAKSLRGAEWKFLSIPPGGTSEYNKNPTLERGTGVGAQPAT